VTVMVLALPMIALPHIAGVVSSSRRQGVRHTYLIGVVVATLAAAWTGVLLVLPDQLGTELFGGSWSVAEPLLLGVGAYATLSGTSAAMQLGFRAQHAASVALRIRFVAGPLLIVLPAVVGAVSGIGAAVVGLVVVEGATLALLVYFLDVQGRAAPFPVEP
jgi:O-antigen/teichoic acid export membrane protein